MLITDDDADQLKRWVIGNIDDSSEVDPDVLADYAIALIRADEPEFSLKQKTHESLKDFLGLRSESFVEEFFAEINRNAYNRIRDPVIAAPAPAVLAPSALIAAQIDPSYIPPSRTGQISIASERTSNQARKRTWQDAQDPHDVPTAQRRPAKLGKRAGIRSTTHVAGNTNGFNHLHPLSYSSAGLPAAPTGPHGYSQLQLPNIDPIAALTAMLAMQAQIMGLPNPDFSKLLPTLDQAPPCRDYHDTGRCDRGILCQYSHQLHYDPNDPTPLTASAAPRFNRSTSAPGGGVRGGRKRAAFSMLGPSFDKFNTRIVVEQIPEENCEEEQVLTFFQSFGTIEDVDMQPYKHLAIVRYADHDSAQAAFNSPKVIFDNRFVKVYWYNADNMSQLGANGANGSAKPVEPDFDRAKFKEQNAEAQRKHEARIQARSVAQARAAEIEEKRAALAKEYNELKEKLEARGIELQTEFNVNIDSNGKKKHHDTNALKAQLAQLEAEARGMGIDVEAMDEDGPDAGGHSYQYRGRSRGNFRGRSRGRATRGYWGSWSTRGASHGARATNVPYRGSVQAGGRYNLDLRPRRIRVSLLEEDADWAAAKEEALREHLFSLGDFSLEHGGESDSTTEAASDNTITVVFKDRPTAEGLYFGPRYIPGIGKFDCAWVAGPAASTATSSTIIIDNNEVDEEDEDVDAAGDDTVMGNAPADRTSGDASNGRVARRGFEEDDYDIAEEDERWVVT